MVDYNLNGIYKINGTISDVPQPDFSSVPINIPKYNYGVNVWMNGCKYWQYVPLVEQQNPPQFWDIILDDKDTLEVNLNVSLAGGKCGYDAMYLRFHNATIKNIPVGTQDIGCFWLYKDGQPMLNPSIPQYFAAPAHNPGNPDGVWGSAVNILFDGSNIKTGSTKYDLVYRGRNPFSPKSFEIELVNSAENVC